MLYYRRIERDSHRDLPNMCGAESSSSLFTKLSLTRGNCERCLCPNLKEGSAYSSYDCTALGSL